MHTWCPRHSSMSGQFQHQIVSFCDLFSIFYSHSRCELCNKTFPTGKLLSVHKFRHKTFQCDYCGKTLNSKSAIIHHLFTNHVKTDPTHKCDICNKKFQLQSLLKCHKYAAHRNKIARVTCELCGKFFYAQFFLNKHMITAHTDKSERLAMRKQCEFCGEWLLSKSGIYYHKQVSKKKQYSTHSTPYVMHILYFGTASY